MQNNLKKFSLEFVAGFLCSMFGYIPISIICALLLQTDNVGTVLIALFSAYPLGSILGILLIERIVFKAIRWNIIAMGIGIASGLVGGYLGLVMLDKIPDISILLIQLIITGLVLVAYNISLLVNFREKSLP
jgi:hypothetical protein